MNSSGIKRGVAAFAIAAVAVTGVPALTSTAFADNLNQQAEENALGLDQVVLMNASNRAISTRPDGTDSTVRLEAAAGRDVATIRFEYSINGGATWNTAGDATRNDDGAFSFEWATPPVGQVIRLRARDITPLGAGETDTSTDIEVFGNDENTETINLKSETDKGYYDACAGGINVSVSGTRSEDRAGFDNAPFIGSVGVDDDTVWEDGPFVADYRPAGLFSGIIDLANYDFANTPGEFPDQLAVRARTDSDGIPASNETEDFEAYSLYEQALTTVTVTDNGTGNGGLPTEVTVKVVDQRGNVVAGARVVQANTGQSRETNSRGEAYFDQFTNPVGGQQYFADEDCNGIFQSSAGDRTAPPFLAGGTATSMVITSAPEGRRPVGSSTTETVTVTNGAGAPIVGRQVRFTRTGPDGSSEVVFRTTDAAGKATYVATCTTAGTISIQAAIQDPSGSGTPQPTDPFNRFANDKIGCGSVTPPSSGKAEINPAIKGKNLANGNDRILIRAKKANGAEVVLYQIIGKNRRVKLAEGRLNAQGEVVFIVRDRNPGDTSYKAVVKATSDTQRGATQRRLVPKAGR